MILLRSKKSTASFASALTMAATVIFSPVLFSAVFTSCQTTKVSLMDYSPAAIMTVYSNPGLPWYEETTGSDSHKVDQEDDGVLTGFINRALNQNDPERLTAQDRVDSAAKIFQQTLADSGIQVISPDTLKDSNIYKNAGKSFLDVLNNCLPAQGYDVFTSSGRKLNRMTAQETGAKSLLYVHFHFSKQKLLHGFNSNEAAARVLMSVYGADQDGNTIINKQYTCLSTKTVPLRRENYDKELFVTFYDDAIKSCCNQFAADFFPAVQNSAETLPQLQDQILIQEQEADAQAVSIPKPNRIQ